MQNAPNLYYHDASQVNAMFPQNTTFYENGTAVSVWVHKKSRNALSVSITNRPLPVSAGDGERRRVTEHSKSGQKNVLITRHPFLKYIAWADTYIQMSLQKRSHKNFGPVLGRY